MRRWPPPNLATSAARRFALSTPPAPDPPGSRPCSSTPRSACSCATASTTGAVYSNFRGKHDLFLAVLDAEAKRRFPLHTEAMLTPGSIEEGLRASAREMATYAREHPGWTGVCVEFWTHASWRPALRSRVAEQHERLLDTVGGPLEGWTARWEIEFTLPAREVVRGIYFLRCPRRR